jgi:hypothetical protein
MLEVRREPYSSVCDGLAVPHLIVVRGVLGRCKQRCHDQGQQVGGFVLPGDDLPTPGRWPHPDIFRDAIYDVLDQRGLFVSTLGRVLEAA